MQCPKCNGYVNEFIGVCPKCGTGVKKDTNFNPELKKENDIIDFMNTKKNQFEAYKEQKSTPVYTNSKHEVHDDSKDTPKNQFESYKTNNINPAYQTQKKENTLLPALIIIGVLIILIVIAASNLIRG